MFVPHPATCGGFCGWLAWLTGSSESELEDEFEHVVKHAATRTKKRDRVNAAKDFILLFIMLSPVRCSYIEINSISTL